MAAAAAATAATIGQMQLQENFLEEKRFWKNGTIFWNYEFSNLLQNHAHENGAVFAVNFHAEPFQFEFSW